MLGHSSAGKGTGVEFAGGGVQGGTRTLQDKSCPPEGPGGSSTG